MTVNHEEGLTGNHAPGCSIVYFEYIVRVKAATTTREKPRS